MALFIIRHDHPAERCPAADPEMGAQLVNHLSRPHVRSLGIEIHGEAVVEGEHTIYMVVESSDEDRVRDFLRPFAMAGSVEVYHASTCVSVISRGGCVPERAAVEDAGSAMDAGEACQRAIEAGLVVHRAHPLNCETSIHALLGGVVMPNAHFYVRNHFQIPRLDPTTWRLEVGGLVERPLSLSLRDLMRMRSQTLVVTLECAGNGRSLLDPPVEWEKWDLGAVSTAEWTGVPLAEVLDLAGVEGAAGEVVFRGADGGTVEGRAEPISFERSLKPDIASGSDAVLAYAMNGESLPIQHGYPLRLVVPGWYAVTSVKWLTEIELIEGAFDGYFQADKYQYEWERGGELVREPVTLQRVRSLITEPHANEPVQVGDLVVRGVAWSGAAPIARVEVSLDDGPWQEARLVGERRPHRWQWWELIVRVDRPGSRALRSRATDLAGRTQPERPEWNRLGYGNNAVRTLPVEIR
jgi:DMSO/TMAO reductase YedYZ molybdopterin-dependent catalytic subunit